MEVVIWLSSTILVCVDTKMFGVGEWDVVAGVPPKEVAEQVVCAGVESLDMYNKVPAFTSSDHRSSQGECLGSAWRAGESHNDGGEWILELIIIRPSILESMPSKMSIGVWITSYTSSRDRNMVWGDQYPFIVMDFDEECVLFISYETRSSIQRDIPWGNYLVVASGPRWSTLSRYLLLTWLH